MPSFLQDAVVEVDTGLPVVGAGGEVNGPVKAGAVALELADVDLGEIHICY
jgi:hypothetical protein